MNKNKNIEQSLKEEQRMKEINKGLNPP